MLNKRYHNFLLSLKYGLLIVWVISISILPNNEMVVSIISVLLAATYVLFVINLIRNPTRSTSKKTPIIFIQILIIIILVVFSVWTIF